MGSLFVKVWMGWGGVLLGILLAIMGFVKSNEWHLFGAALAVAGFSWYLAQTPAFGVVGYIFPALFVASGFAVKAGKSNLAGALIVPFVLVAGWVAISALLTW